jgi:hypothetical protein
VAAWRWAGTLVGHRRAWLPPRHSTVRWSQSHGLVVPGRPGLADAARSEGVSMDDETTPARSAAAIVVLSPGEIWKWIVWLSTQPRETLQPPTRCELGGGGTESPLRNTRQWARKRAASSSDRDGYKSGGNNHAEATTKNPTTNGQKSSHGQDEDARALPLPPLQLPAPAALDARGGDGARVPQVRR